MKTKDLINVWDKPNYGKLTPKQVSIRLPILLAAKISALCEMYPRKTKTEIIIDLLSTSLEQLEESMPSEKEALIDNEPSISESGEFHNFTYNVYEDIGVKGKFSILAEKHLRILEQESGSENSMPFKKHLIYEKDFSGNRGEHE
jgi:hypothetical protein